nr:hypothetical protein [Streptomyces sp. XM4193]
MVLIGGTSNVGKSTVAQLVAETLGFECLSTDALARHPGRPWRTVDREVPAHVAEHYASLSVDELITSVCAHYDRLRPRVEELITARAADDRGGAGLVLEGSALWPTHIAGLRTPHTAAVWLTADASLIRARIHAAGHYETATGGERELMDKFLARSERYQALLTDALGGPGPALIDAGGGRSAAEAGSGRSAAELAAAVLAAVDAQTPQTLQTPQRRPSTDR